MEEKLALLGLNEKEIKVYLYLIEYWISWASEIWKRVNIPKSTANFLADNLWRKWFLKKTFSWNTGLYEADIGLLQENIEKEILLKKEFIENIIPLLKEKNKNIISKPKIKFFDGIEGCKKAYSDILKIKWTFYEFWAHEDLENAFWKKFMQDFIQARIIKPIFCDSIGTFWEAEEALQKLDGEQKRNLKVFPKDFWEINSSIVIYDNKVLILNLNWIYNGVLIENNEFSQTMKTIFLICKGTK